jgi:hypothetical protein
MGKETLLYCESGTERPFVVVSEGLGMAKKRESGSLGLTFAPEHIFIFGADGRRVDTTLGTNGS